jgi:hypothetical protein
MNNVRSLPDWPPDPGGAGSTSGYKTPSSEEATVVRLGPQQIHGWVTFVALFEDKEHTYDFEATTEESAIKLRGLIAENLGKSVYEIGALEFDDAAA